MQFDIKDKDGTLMGMMVRDSKEEAVAGTMRLLKINVWPKGWTCEPRPQPENAARLEALAKEIQTPPIAPRTRWA